MISRTVRWGLVALAGFAFLASSTVDSPAMAQDAKAGKVDDKKPVEPKTAEQAVQLGLKAANEGKLDDALVLFQKGVKLDPKHRPSMLFVARVKMVQASAAQGKKQYELYKEAAKGMRELKAAYPKLDPMESQLFATCVYNEACAHSLEKNLDKSIAALKEAFAAGFTEIGQLEEDGDLANVRNHPDFAVLKKELVAKAAEAAKAKIKALLADNKPFPFDFELKNLDGKPVKLADFKGKVTIVDIWGTWCPPCRKEIPHFVELHKKLSDKGFAIVGINYEGGDDEKEDIKKIKAFNKENKVPYECLIGDEKTQKQVKDFQGYPTTLFLDRDGKVRAKLVGYTEMSELEALVSTLLDEAKP